MRAVAETLTLSDVFLPRQGILENNLLRNGVLMVTFSLFIALCARIAIPLLFTTVPITGQTMAVLLTGAALGKWRGAGSLLFYIAEGSLGLPFFAGGRSYLFWAAPNGGYLVGFIFAAFLVGFLAERGWDRGFRRTALAMLVGNIVIYLFGLPWLAYFIANNFLNLSNIIPGNTLLEKTLVGGLIPFIPGDLVKLLLASLVLPGTWVLVKRRGD